MVIGIKAWYYIAERVLPQVIGANSRADARKDTSNVLCNHRINIKMN
jgi:hypothetical protein